MSFPWWLIVLALLLLAGTFLRVRSFEPSVTDVGFDESMYVRYVRQIDQVGVLRLPEVFEFYTENQAATPTAFLPPTRVAFLLAAESWHLLFQTNFLGSVKAVSTAASIVFLAVSALFAFRLGGRPLSVAITALVAFAPTQIYIAHRALIDGFFSMVALFVLWTLWELLQSPHSRKWTAAYGIALALMVLTKENAAFVYLAVLGILLLCRFINYGKVTRSLLVVTVLGACAGFATLALCAGGVGTLFAVLSLNVEKSLVLPYAIATGDGPWFRYISDMLLLSPIVMILALSGIFQIKRDNKPAAYFLVFIIFSYFCMCNVRHGINLRYALIWDFPLRYLALTTLIACVSGIENPKKRSLVFLLAVALVAASELASYRRIFVAHQVYDLVPVDLLKALNIIKPPPGNQ